MAQGISPELAGETRSLLAGLPPRLEALAQHAARWWLECGVDHEWGGFHGTLDSQGRPALPTDKGLVQQARHLWAFSTYYQRRSPTPEIRTVAEDTYRFVITRLRDPSDGEFFYTANRQGEVTNRMKKLYAQSFAIYALAAYGRVFCISEALDYALGCFRSLDARVHDQAHGGYDQSGETLSWIGGLPKGTNTHIHLMEAFAELGRATGDEQVRVRLSELVDLIATRLLQPERYVHAAFSAAWEPQGGPVVSYGHDLETAWLLMDAARVLDRAADPQLVEAALRMGEHSAERGYDAQDGGYFYEGVPAGEVTNREKIWWVQFEALAGLWWVYQLSGKLVQLERLERTLAWLEATRDRDHGEWFGSLLPDGSLGSYGPNKGDEWKASYHSLRGLLFTADWIRQALEQG
jgi:mannobiose 2-epimerase